MLQKGNLKTECNRTESTGKRISADTALLLGSKVFCISKQKWEGFITEFLPQNFPSHSLILFQFDVMKRYLDGGGSILVMLGEGGESRFETNVNFFLEEFGISINTG